MNKIKFSNDYHKLPEKCNGNTAYLLFAHPLMLEAQTQQFLNYDTEAREAPDYKLPKKGKYILLAFLVAGTFFTTLRRYTDEKWKYYESNVQTEFVIEIAEASK